MAELGGLAAAWDDCRTIRSRFRKQWPWLQWPYYVSHDDGKDNEESSTPKHPACTKALELNAEALLCMLDFYGCTFAEIPQLQDEAIICSHQRLSFDMVCIISCSFFGIEIMYSLPPTGEGTLPAWEVWFQDYHQWQLYGCLGPSPAVHVQLAKAMGCTKAKPDSKGPRVEEWFTF